MARIIAVANQKGGVGKTTTCNAIASGMHLRGYKTIAIDSDQQCNLTHTMNATGESNTLYEVLKGEIPPSDAIRKTEQGDVITGSLDLAGADMEFTDTGREYMLVEALEKIERAYDYIVIDCPPQLGILTINALTAADDLIIPLGADIYSLQGLSQIYKTVQKLRKRCNPRLKISGLLITRYSGRTMLGKALRDIIAEKAEQLDTTIYDAIIRENVAIKEAQVQMQSIFGYAPKSNAAQDYNEFLDEYLRKAVSMNAKRA